MREWRLLTVLNQWDYRILSNHSNYHHCSLGKITVELFKKPTAEAEAAASDYVDIVTFDGAKSTTYTFHDLNDPVMGGLSKSTFTVDKTGGFAVFNGTVAVVPSLKAPGFCNAETLNPFAKFADASGKTHLWIKARTTTPNYPGYKVSLAADTFNPQFKSFKANFDLKGNDGKTFEWVGIPFVPGFSNDWSAFTGDCDTKDPNGGKQHVCCKTGKEDVCMTEKNKKDFSQVGFWTEGHAADFHIEIERIGAGGATAPAL